MEYGNNRDCIGIRFKYSLLTASKPFKGIQARNLTWKLCKGFIGGYVRGCMGTL